MVQSVGLLIIRAMLGCVMIYHGSQKVFEAFDGTGMDPVIQKLTSKDFPYPMVSAYAVAFTELLGGAFLVLGLVARVSAVFIAGVMFVAAFMFHAQKFGLEQGGMEYALTLAVVATGLLFTGPGMFSADGLFRRIKPTSDS